MVDYFGDTMIGFSNVSFFLKKGKVTIESSLGREKSPLAQKKLSPGREKSTVVEAEKGTSGQTKCRARKVSAGKKKSAMVLEWSSPRGKKSLVREKSQIFQEK